MFLAFEDPAEAVRAQGLDVADEHIAVIELDEAVAVNRHQGTGGFEIMLQEFLPDIGHQVRFGLVEQGSQVVLQRTSSSALIINKIRLSAANHDIARLKIAEEEVVGVGGEQEIGERMEVFFQGGFAEPCLADHEEVVLEVVEVEEHSLFIESGLGIAVGFVVEVLSPQDLEAG